MDNNIQRVELLGVHVDVLDIPLLNKLIKFAIQNRKKWIIANHNLHSIYLYHYSSGMSDFYEAARYIHIDGMILIGIGKLLHLPLTQRNRVAYIDWIIPLVEIASKNSWRIYYLGSKPGVAEKGARILQRKFPELVMETHHGYFNPIFSGEDNIRIVNEINNFNPNIILVGMGMPRQEKWILDNLNYLNVNIFLNAGACMDYLAGEIPVTPRWLGKIGMEWSYRLLLNPRYFWRRYFIEPWFLLKYFFVDCYKLFKQKSRA
jgi:N-acetylglucosaminyldiphosphoundecaprenol N-acetyl-beta-D-mannosaminyltransferase